MSKSIMIVEDDPTNMKLFIGILQANGYETITALNGEQSVRLAEVHRPDLILLDIMMPVMDGFEASKILKTNASTKRIPVIALSSLAMSGDRDKILQFCDDYISKPIDLHSFLAKVRQYLPAGTDAERQDE